MTATNDAVLNEVIAARERWRKALDALDLSTARETREMQSEAFARFKESLLFNADHIIALAVRGAEGETSNV